MQCAICRNTKFDTISVLKLNKKYFRCNKCEFIFIEPSQLISPEEEKQRYLQHNNSSENKGYVTMFNEFINKAIVPFNSKIKTALDFGCGHEPVLANILKNKNIQADYYDLYFYPDTPYKQKNYYLITCTEVLEHVINPVKIISELVQILDRNGILAIMTMFYPSDLNEFIKWWYLRDKTHISFFNHNTIKYMADKLHLEIVYLNDKNVCTLRKI